jgi:hypothetical protein
MFVMFILFSMYPLVMLIVANATIIQHMENPLNFEAYKMGKWIIGVLNIPLYIIGIIFVFLAYREVKAALVEMNDGSPRDPMTAPNAESGHEMTQPAPQRPSYGGQGVTVGGGANYDEAWRNQNQNQQPNTFANTNTNNSYAGGTTTTVTVAAYQGKGQTLG